jgi:hypothetical protein
MGGIVVCRVPKEVFKKLLYEGKVEYYGGVYMMRTGHENEILVLEAEK